MPAGDLWKLPNLLSLARVALAPLFLALYAHGETLGALLVFAAAAATDLLDGLAARLLDQHTRLGTLLDPIADKLLELCALVALAARGELPWWLPVLVFSRDLAQLAGALLLRGIRHRVPVAPTRIGKYATFAIVTTVILALAEGVGGLAGAAPFAAAMGLV
ncbi:MAG TPA: CDP-alcohol phosphatidyltransferase family protein, partial [Anaeromyxobacteraceae bacterium]